MRKITTKCFSLILLNFIIQVNSLICNSTIPYSRCSKNSACGCFPMAGADNVGICAFLWKFCSELVSCESSQECYKRDHICVHHHRCNSYPVCYPLSMMNETICPLQSNEIKFNKWNQFGRNIAGGNGKGSDLNQLSHPRGIFIDRNQNIFIADSKNDRIVQWKINENKGKIVVDGNGNKTDQLNSPTDVIYDEENNSLIIAYSRNKRVIRWWNQNQQEILIDNISCWSLTKDKFGFLYVSDTDKNEVRRWKIGEKGEGKLVAGGNGRGNRTDQLNSPRFIVVNDEQSIFVSDYNNHRVMKWEKDAKEGIVVAGGNRSGFYLNQLAFPQGIIVDDFGRIYVSDTYNHRIMRWYEGGKEGEIIVGGNGNGQQSNQLSYPQGLSFDLQGNLYVAEWENHRVQ
ncbi:unnamed protein product, partial [Adineta ricciae]